MATHSAKSQIVGHKSLNFWSSYTFQAV